MKTALKILSAACLILAHVHSANASDIRAFHSINQLPFKQVYGIPSLENSPLTDPDTWRIAILANISNTFDISASATEQIITDAETARTSLLLRHAVLKNWQLGIEIPYVRHSSGFLDDFIHDWHDVFNMPQNGRTESTNDQIQIAYLSGSVASFSLSDPADSLGDIRISSAFTRPWEKRALVFSSEIKLPTGDYDKLTGSGNFDFSIGMTVNDPQTLQKFRITLFGGMAGVFLGDSDGTMSTLQNNFVLTGMAGLGWRVSDLFHLKLQMSGSSPIYDSDLKELGDPSLQLLMGGSILFSKNMYLDFSIAEDINTTTADDVAFQLAMIVTI